MKHFGQHERCYINKAELKCLSECVLLVSCGDLSAVWVCGHNTLIHCVYIPYLSRKSMYVYTVSATMEGFVQVFAFGCVHYRCIFSIYDSAA